MAGGWPPLGRSPQAGHPSAAPRPCFPSAMATAPLLSSLFPLPHQQLRRPPLSLHDGCVLLLRLARARLEGVARPTPSPSLAQYLFSSLRARWTSPSRALLPVCSTSSASAWRRTTSPAAGGAVRKRSSVEGIRERVAAVPRICIWESEGETGNITCDIVDAPKASMLYREVAPVGGGPKYTSTQRSARRGANRGPCWSSSAVTTPEGKRPGHTISKGHKNYDLMLQLLLGIRHSVGSLLRF